MANDGYFELNACKDKELQVALTHNRGKEQEHARC